MIKWPTRFTPKSAFGRGVGILLGSTAIAQSINLLVAPLLTRLYDPAAFGLLALVAAVISMVTVISSARYEFALSVAIEERETKGLLALSFLFLFLTVSLLIILLEFFGKSAASALGVNSIGLLYFLIPAGVLLAGCHQILTNWTLRNKNFLLVGRAKLAQTVGTAVLQLPGSSYGSAGLIGGDVIGLGFGSLAMSAGLKKRSLLSLGGPAWFYHILRKYKDFPIYSSWSALFNAASVHLAPIVLFSYYSGSIAGYYALTLRVLSVPAAFLAKAISGVFLAHAPEAYRDGTLAPLVESLHKKLGLVGAFALALVFLYGPAIFSYAFGEDWARAGVYARWMAPWLYFQLLWVPISALPMVLDMQGKALFFDLVAFLFRFGGLLGFALLDASSDVGILYFAVISAFVYQLRLLYFVRKARVSILKWLGLDCGFISIAFILVGAPLYLA